MASITIKSEEDAWNILSRATKGTLLGDNIISFEGWPSIQLNFEGDRWNSSIPSRVMEAIILLQREIYRLYAKEVHGNSSFRCLSHEEKAELELVVQILPGSTRVETNLQGVLNALARVTRNMESKHIAIMVVGTALIWGGHDLAKTWLQDQAKEKGVILQQEQQNKQEQLTIDKMKIENEKIKIITDAINQHRGLADTQARTNEIRSKYLASMDKDDTLQISDIIIKGEEAAKILHTPRSKRETEIVRIDGVFRILKVDASPIDGFQLTVRRNEEEEPLSIFAPWGNLTIDDQQLLKGALWDRNPVILAINARKKGDKIMDAELFRVKGNSIAAVIMSDIIGNE